MADFTKFNKFLYQMGQGLYNFSSDPLKFALTNTAPTPATDTVFDHTTKHPPPAAAYGYLYDGHPVTIDSWAEASGIVTLASTTDIIITATAGGIGPFRYAILYNTVGAFPLIGYYDYGSSITLAEGESFTLGITPSLLTIT